jgi:hypothetical protein
VGSSPSAGIVIFVGEIAKSAVNKCLLAQGHPGK